MEVFVRDLSIPSHDGGEKSPEAPLTFRTPGAVTGRSTLRALLVQRFRGYLKTFFAHKTSSLSTSSGIWLELEMFVFLSKWTVWRSWYYGRTSSPSCFLCCLSISPIRHWSNELPFSCSWDELELGHCAKNAQCLTKTKLFPWAQSFLLSWQEEILPLD
jgi:hypothetical protein